MSATICRLVGPGDGGEPDGIGIELQALSFDSIDITAWDDEGNHVEITIDSDEIDELRHALNALSAATGTRGSDGQR